MSKCKIDTMDWVDCKTKLWGFTNSGWGEGGEISIKNKFLNLGFGGQNLNWEEVS